MDTPEHNFEKIAWSPSAVEKLLAELGAGADLHSSRYARVLLHWPPSTSCHLE